MPYTVILLTFSWKHSNIVDLWDTDKNLLFMWKVLICPNDVVVGSTYEKFKK